MVTGASEGLGRAIVPLLCRDGYDVIAVARRREALESLSGEVAGLPGGVLPLPADLTEHDGIDAVSTEVASRGVGLHLLVNNAGRGDIGAFGDADTASLRGILRLNIEALTLLSRRLLPSIAEGGIILNVASVAAVLPGPGMAVYYASKAYVLSLGVALSEELRPRGVSVTTVCPGPIATGFQRVAGFDEDEYDRTTRAVSPEKVAEWAYRKARRRRRVAFYRWYRISDWAARLLPRRLFARIMAAYQRRRAPKNQ